VEFVVCGRPGERVVSLPPPFRLRFLGGVPTAISASAIRDRVREGRPVDLLLPGAVAEAVVHSGLYL
jgi:nicotinic acid mononucleotide adenylyltransferase